MEKRPSSETIGRIQSEFLANGDAVQALAARSALVDRTVAEAAGELLLTAVPAGLALLAVGGYGRRELYPHSDVDLLLLFASEKLAHASREAISRFLQRLWDSDLRLSHSVRTPEECCELHDRNIELNISLLDQRFLAGDRGAYAAMAERLPRFIHGQRDALARNLARLTRERHAKFGDTLHHLEPNVKETPGGLRDYQVACWLAQIRAAGPSAAVSTGLPAQLEEAHRHLAAVRCHLHYRAGRDRNVLGFEAQEEIAERQGLEPAAWMREYFRHARAVYRQAMKVLQASEAQTSTLFTQFRDWRSRLSNAEFTVSRERVHFRAPQQIEADPEIVLRLCQFTARHGIQPSLETGQRIEARLPQIAGWLRERRPLWPAVRELLSLPYAPLALRVMHETGLMRALFPELDAIECLVVRDFYHRYTVDEHTLVAIQNLADLRGSGDPARRRFRDILSEIEEPAVLLFALLFHDAGKGIPGQGHVDASLRLAETAMERIEVPLRDRDTVWFLIGAHLEMSAAMHSRDIYDPAAARDLAQRVGTVERLKSLTLVTYADISAVNPTAMTTWRAEQLFQLYLLVYNELTRELDTGRIEKPEAASAELQAFLEGLPKRYLRTHSPEDVEGHFRLMEESRKRGVAVDLRRLSAAWRMTVITHDRPFLFASIAGTLSSFGMNILKAEAFANRAGAILDTFTFEDPSRTLELNPSEIDRLRSVAERVILGKADVKQLLQNRPQPPRPSRKAGIAPVVSFDSEASASATLIQIVGEDRPGLLYDVASAISSQGCNIEVVLIDTEAHKAIDVFYVTAGGHKLAPHQQQTLGEALRRACAPA